MHDEIGASALAGEFVAGALDVAKCQAQAFTRPAEPGPGWIPGSGNSPG